MIQEFGDTPPVITVPLLPDWTYFTLQAHSKPSPRDHDAAGTRTRPISPEEAGLDPLVGPSGHGDQSDSDCQIQEPGPEPDSSTAPASDGLGQPRGTRLARYGEVETLQPSRIRPWRDLEWQRTLPVGTGLNNLKNTCFCNAVLHCLTHTAPLANFCLDHGHSRQLGNATATEDYDALLAVEGHVIEAFGSRQNSIASTSIVENRTKTGSHFAAGVQQDAHEFLQSLTANMHLADLRVGRSPCHHNQQHTSMLHGILVDSCAAGCIADPASPTGQAVSCNSNWWWCVTGIFEAVERNRYFHWQFCVISDPCV